MNLNHKNHDTL